MAKVIVFKAEIREAKFPEDWKGTDAGALNFVNEPPECSEMRTRLYSVIRGVMEATASKAGDSLGDIVVLRFEGGDKMLVLPT